MAQCSNSPKIIHSNLAQSSNIHKMLQSNEAQHSNTNKNLQRFLFYISSPNLLKKVQFGSEAKAIYPTHHQAPIFISVAIQPLLICKYFFLYLQLNHCDPAMPGKHEIFIGPRTFRRFLDAFRYIYSTKSKENTARVGQLR